MQLEHSFSVPVGIDEAWKVLLDIKRIGPCMPGASIDSVDGDDFTGSVKVKLGPINLTYKGKASFVEKDEAAHRAVIDARGRDARGNGTAAAKVTATLADAGGSSTTVLVNTDLDITGKPAQFGRGVMVDVGNKLIGQFADRLAAQLTSGEDAAGNGSAAPAPAADSTSSPTATVEAPTSTSAAASTAAANGSESDRTPSYSAPGGIPNTSPTTPAAATSNTSWQATPSAGPADQDVEPIDLLGSAGPAVAKRLAPVAVAVLVVVVAVVRKRRKRS